VGAGGGAGAFRGFGAGRADGTGMRFVLAMARA
jgi:hypothetical protein